MTFRISILLALLFLSTIAISAPSIHPFVGNYVPVSWECKDSTKLWVRGVLSIIVTDSSIQLNTCAFGDDCEGRMYYQGFNLKSFETKNGNVVAYPYTPGYQFVFRQGPGPKQWTLGVVYEDALHTSEQKCEGILRSAVTL